MTSNVGQPSLEMTSRKIMYGSLDYSRDRRSQQNLDGSIRSLISESSSLLSGLSQARKISSRRRNPSSRAEKKSHGGNCSKGLTSKLPTSIAVMSLNSETRSPARGERLHRSANAAKLKKQQVAKIILVQSYARGYMSRFACKSRLIMVSCCWLN